MLSKKKLMKDNSFRHWKYDKLILKLYVTNEVYKYICSVNFASFFYQKNVKVGRTKTRERAIEKRRHKQKSKTD